MRRFAAVCAAVIAMPVAAQDVGAIADALHAHRQPNGLPALYYNPQLSAAAEAHARDMSANGFMSHTGSDGSQLTDRVNRTGYCWQTVAENIAWRIRGEAEVVRQWMRSRGHRRNILNRQITDFGVARAGDNYWVLVLARARSC